MITSGHAAEKVKAADFRKGITCHQDWIDRLKETMDYRIFKILASRGGAKCTTDKAKKVMDFLKNNPAKFESTLKKWRIIRDLEKLQKKDMEDWKALYGEEVLLKKTKHYLFMGTKNNAVILKSITLYLEKIFYFYEKIFKTGEKIEGLFVVKLYPSKNEFRKHNNNSTAFAFFRASDRSLVGYVPEKKGYYSNEKNIIDVLVHTFFHEGFHQYLRYFIPNPPIWLNEGFAEMFESITVNKYKLVQGKLIHYYDLLRVKKLIETGSVTPLEKLLYMSQSEFYIQKRISYNYSQAWSLLHFFAFGSKQYNVYYTNLMTHLRNGMDPKEAMDATFKNVDFQKLQAAWIAYVKKLRARKSINVF